MSRCLGHLKLRESTSRTADMLSQTDIGTGQAKPSITLEPLDVLSRLEPSRGASHAHWWKRTGPQLALMLKEAGYTVDKQFEVLLFYYHWIVCHHHRWVGSTDL